MIRTVAISGYRSLRDFKVGLGALSIVSGGNGAGKSSLYRALRLLADCSVGGVIQSLAIEGGLSSTLWAGPESFSRAMRNGDQPVQGTRRRKAISLKLGYGGDDYGYAIDLGLPAPSRSYFSHDPEIKSEHLWLGAEFSVPKAIAERKGPGVRIRDDEGRWRQAYTELAAVDSMMTHCSDPTQAVELLIAREQMRDWRFYDHFRTDSDAPVRRAHPGTYTPVLSADGHDLAAALQTIREIGDVDFLNETVADAFGGAAVDIDTDGNGAFTLRMSQPGLLRELTAAELSDGTLRYLLLVGALLSPRPPSLMVLNEPETSLHPDLLEPLARLIAHAADSTQLVVVSHSKILVDALAASPQTRQLILEKQLGETIVPNANVPDWRWPTNR